MSLIYSMQKEMERIKGEREGGGGRDRKRERERERERERGREREGEREEGESDFPELCGISVPTQQLVHRWRC